MTESQSNTIARVFGGRTWQPYPGLWWVIVVRPDQRLVVIGTDNICVYADAEALHAGDPLAEIRFD